MRHYIIFLWPLYYVSVIADPAIISQSFQGNDFNNADGKSFLIGQQKGWNVINALSGISVCSGIKIFGGYDFFGRNAVAIKQFKFPPHSLVYLKLTFYQIHSWDIELFQIWLDDQQVFNENYKWSQATNPCGNGLTYAQYQVTLVLKHTGPKGIVIFTSSLDEPGNNEAWGIRDFEISVEKCPSECHACQQGDTAETCKVWILDQSYWVIDLFYSGFESEGWTVKGGLGTNTTCGGIDLFGGFQRFGVGSLVKRNIYLKPHYRLKFKLLFVKIDGWENEYAVLKINDKEFWKKKLIYYDGPIGNVCGRSDYQRRELFVRVEADVAHTGGDQLTFTISSTINDAPITKSWGVKDFYIFYAACSPNCGMCTGPLPEDCTQCLNNWIMQNGNCTPPENFIQFESSFWENTFTNLEGWVLINNDPGKFIYQCNNGKTLVGGFNSLGQGASATKKISLPPHKRLRFILTIYKIDTWDSEWLIIKLDSVLVWKKQFGYQNEGDNLCGQIYTDYIEQVDEIIVHSQLQSEIQITSSLDQVAIDESWGFREFKLLYEPKQECVIFYTECDYKGQSFDFCIKSANFQNDSIPPVIKSIKVPPQAKVTFYEKADYKGGKVSYTTNQNCISSMDLQFVLQSGTIVSDV